MQVRAYAKINVGLRVLGKRQDGYHDIETIFQLIDCYDTISLSHGPDVQFTCRSAEVPSDRTNLCVRAAERLREAFQVRRGVSISLNKQIPVGAGLGGGSSDAAAVLRGLNMLWDLKLGLRTLGEVAGELGSDVPFFLGEGKAYATGRGEKLEAMLLSLPYWILTVTPAIHISTAWAYSQLGAGPGSSAVSKAQLEKTLQTGDALRERIVNDFESLVFKHHPVIRRLKDSLYEHGSRFALMSGSGSSVFGFFETKDDAERARTHIDPAYYSSLTEPHFRAPRDPDAS